MFYKTCKNQILRHPRSFRNISPNAEKRWNGNRTGVGPDEDDDSKRSAEGSDLSLLNVLDAH